MPRLVLIAALWAVAWIALTWGGLLDDALIHLRVAEMSRAAGFLTFDGATSSFVSSSLGFVALLVAGGMLTAAAWLPQAVSVAAYAACLWFASVRALRGRAPRACAVLLLVLVVPAAVRWMTNGMETSLAAFLALALGARVATLRHPLTWPTVLPLAALSAAAVLVRTEFIGIAACAALVCLTAYGRRDGILAALSLAAGAGAPVLATVLIFGTAVSDGAVAKAMGPPGLLPALEGIVITHLSATAFGAGLMVLSAFAAATAVMRSRSRREQAAVVLAAMPIVLAVAAVVIRGQALQGVRYFVPFHLFTIGFALAWIEMRQGEAVSRRGLAIVAAVLLAGASVESGFVLRTQRASAEVVRRMDAQPLERLTGVTGIAWDVGFIAYFTHADICDVNGLVNGRERALTPAAQRLADCAARHPRFAYLTAEEMPALAGALDIDGWVACDSYTIPLVRQQRTHRLLVAPELAPEVCPQAASPVR